MNNKHLKSKIVNHATEKCFSSVVFTSKNQGLVLDFYLKKDRFCLS